MEGKSPRSLFAGVFHKFWWCALLKNLYARGRKIKWRREYFPFRIETSRYFYYSALMKIYILLRQNRTARCYSRPTLEIFLGDFNSPWFVSRSFHRSPSLLRPQPPIPYASAFHLHSRRSAVTICQMHIQFRKFTLFPVKENFYERREPLHKFENTAPAARRGTSVSI